jgi:Mrp family chromosome partitioning ATPase
MRQQRGQPMAEEYYSLVHWLRAMGDMSGTTHKSIGVTSCTRGAGVSTVASNLAIVAADIDDRPVLLLDLSAGRAAASGLFRTTNDTGLRDALADTGHAACYARPTPVANLSLLAADSDANTPMANLDSARVGDLVRSLENEFSFIVLDLPTVESSLCFITAGLLNGVLLVIEAERTRLETAARAKQRLIDARANVLGVILNKHRQHMPNWLEARL